MKSAAGGFQLSDVDLAAWRHKVEQGTVKVSRDETVALIDEVTRLRRVSRRLERQLGIVARPDSALPREAQLRLISADAAVMAQRYYDSRKWWIDPAKRPHL